MATTQLYFYPPSATVTSSANASVGPTGQPVPTDATLIAGRNPSGLLLPVNVDADGDLIIGSSVLPTGAATSANQVTEIASLADIDTATASIDAKTPALGQALAAASVPVVLTAAQIGVLATESTLAAMSAKLPASIGAKTSTGSLSMVPATDALFQSHASGKASANAPARNDYTLINVTTAAYQELVNSTTSASTEIEIFDSSGQTLVLALGGSGSEVNQLNIFPGGNGRIPLAIPAGTRVSIKAVSATANAGEIDINFYA